MQLTVRQDYPETGLKSITFTISEKEIFSVEKNSLDKALLDECEKSDKISDKLRCLEFIARKIEQGGK